MAAQFPIYFPVGKTGIVAQLDRKMVAARPTYDLSLYVNIASEYASANDGWGTFKPLLAENHKQILRDIINAVYKDMHEEYEKLQQATLYVNSPFQTGKQGIFNFLETSLTLTPLKPLEEGLVVASLKASFAKALSTRSAAIAEIERANARQLNGGPGVG